MTPCGAFTRKIFLSRGAAPGRQQGRSRPVHVPFWRGIHAHALSLRCVVRARTRAHRHRAIRPRRARLRHLFATAARAHRVPRRARERAVGQPDRGATALSRVREPRQGYLLLHQLAGRFGLRRPRHLRHDAVHQARRIHALHWLCRQHGHLSARRGASGQALRAAERTHHDPPAVGRQSGHGRGRGDPGEGSAVSARSARRRTGGTHGADARADPQRHRPRQLHVGERGESIWSHRRCAEFARRNGHDGHNRHDWAGERRFACVKRGSAEIAERRKRQSPPEPEGFLRRYSNAATERQTPYAKFFAAKSQFTMFQNASTNFGRALR
ncbi:protein of unknown function [Paraburkholderia kururiensis]